MFSWSDKVGRREFIGTGVSAVAAIAAGGGRAFAGETAGGTIQTVLGAVPAAELGFALPHEHVMCDFVGAGETGRHRWEVDAVVARMKPVLAELKARGVKTFFDCTPAYIGRDPRVLRPLAEATGLHIVTNTGYYGGAGDKFVPRHAFEESAERLAQRWTREWEEGIEGTGVKPGFMKIGVDAVEGNGRLSAIDRKLVKAGAIASRKTGLTVVCHTGGGPAGLQALEVFIGEGGKAGRFVVAHADGHGIATNRKVAELGGWVSFDGVSRRPLEEHLKLVGEMIQQHAGRLLISHDNGWYNVGQENGGEVRDYNYMPDVFLPALRKSGASEAAIRQLTVENPARAFRNGG